MCGRFDPSTDPVDAEQTKGEAVVLDRVFTDEIADNARDGCKNLFVPRDEAWIGGAREKQSAKADHGRALQLQCHPLGWIDGCSLDPRAPGIERAVGTWRKSARPEGSRISNGSACS
jgi:hypothetical protein